MNSLGSVMNFPHTEQFSNCHMTNYIFDISCLKLYIWFDTHDHVGIQIDVFLYLNTATCDCILIDNLYLMWRI